MKISEEIMKRCPEITNLGLTQEGNQIIVGMRVGDMSSSRGFYYGNNFFDEVTSLYNELKSNSRKVTDNESSEQLYEL